MKHDTVVSPKRAVTRHSDLSEMVERRVAIIAEQAELIGERRFLEEQVVEKLCKDGRWDVLSVNWSKLARMG